MVDNQPLRPTPEVTPDGTPDAEWTWTHEAADAFGHTLNIREKEILHGPGARRGRRIASVVSNNISDAVLIAKAPEMLEHVRGISNRPCERQDGAHCTMIPVLPCATCHARAILREIEG